MSATADATRRSAALLQMRNNALAGFQSAAQQIQKFGMTVLISAGVVALVLAALLIWPAVIAIRESKAVSRGEKTETSTATGIAIAAAVVGGLLLIGSIVGLAMGVVSIGTIGLLLTGALLIVGAIAAHRMIDKDSRTQQPYENRGSWAHAAAGLWIATIVIGLVLPGIAAIVLGSAIGSFSLGATSSTAKE